MRQRNARGATTRGRSRLCRTGRGKYIRRFPSNETVLLDTPVNIERVSIAAPETAEAIPVSARNLMINGRAPGQTSLVIWLADGSRREYTLDVKINASRIEAAKGQIDREFGNNVQLTIDNGSVYLTGRVKDLYEADRALSIAAVLGKVWGGGFVGLGVGGFFGGGVCLGM